MEQELGAKWREAAPGTFPVAGVGRDIRFNKRQWEVSRELGVRESNTHYELTIDFF